MGCHVIYHLEDSRYVGVWPSHAESISLMAKAFGVASVQYVDQSMDGFHNQSLISHVPHTRRATLGDCTLTGTVVGVETSDVDLGVVAQALSAYTFPTDVTLVFGDHNGLAGAGISFDAHVYLDYAGMPVRDCVACVLYEWATG